MIDWRHVLSLLSAALLGACTSLPPGPAGEGAAIGSSPWGLQSAAAPDAVSGASGWKHYKLPGKTASQFDYVRKDGRDAVAVVSRASASMLRDQIRIEPADLGKLRFSWKVPELIAMADMAVRESDDSPVRIILAFDGDRSRLSAKNAMLSELALTLTGEEMPYATLMYVWCNKRKAGTVISNPRTDRIRKIVVESGAQNLNQWLEYERDIRADYERAFGEAPGALTGIAIMTDTDNTRSRANAWYGPVRLQPVAVSRR